MAVEGADAVDEPVCDVCDCSPDKNPPRIWCNQLPKPSRWKTWQNNVGDTATWEVSFRGSSWETVPDTPMFEKGMELRSVFILGNSKLKALPEKFLAGLEVMWELQIKDNAVLESLPSKLFEGTTLHRGLTIRANPKLAELKDGVFGGLTLPSPFRPGVSLGKNAFETLPGKLFVAANVGLLGRFEIKEEPKLTTLPYDMFQGIEGMTYL